MGYQNNSERVAARSHYRAAGDELDKLLREQLTQLIERFGVPQTLRQQFYDVKRGRAASVSTYGLCIAALASNAELPDAELMRLGAIVYAWMFSFRPVERTTLHTVFERSTAMQARGDISQVHLLFGLEHRDRTKLVRAIEDLGAEISADRTLLCHLIQELRRMDAEPVVRRLHVSRPARQIAAAR